MSKYTSTTTDPFVKKIRYLCDHPDSQPGDVEPCAGTDTEEPSCGIAIMDTDGEWIEAKKQNETVKKFLLSAFIDNTKRKRVY